MAADHPPRLLAQADAEARSSEGLTTLAILFLVALGLRPQIVGVSALVPEITADLQMSHAVAGLVGTAPVLCMGVFALAAPALIGRLGSRRALAVSLATVALAGLARSVAPSTPSFIVLTVVGGVGIALGGAVLPPIVKELAPRRPVAGTASYSSGLQLGAAAAAAVAVPLASSLGGWRASLAAISLACLVPVAVWVATRAGSPVVPRPAIAPGSAVHLRRAALLAVAFGLFSATYYGLVAWLPGVYVEAGWDPTSAGGLLSILNVGALVGALGITAVTRLVGYRSALIGATIAFAAGSVGFTLVPELGGLSAGLAGVANGALFPLLLTQPLRSAERQADVATTSALMLAGGYSLAAIAPVALGALRDATGTFQVSLGALGVASSGLVALAIALERWTDHRVPS